MLEYFCSLEPWRELWDCEVSRAYLLGVGSTLVVIAAFLLLKILNYLFFRIRRCREIIVPAADGDVAIAYGAVESALRRMLAAFPNLELHELRLYTNRRTYALHLVCNYDAARRGGDFPAEIRQLKETIFSELKKLFGIESVRKIRVRLEKFASGAADSQPPRPAEPVQPMKFRTAAEAAEADSDSSDVVIGPL